MLLRERMSNYVFRNVRIHATDVEPQFGRDIAAGIYAEQEVKRIPPPLRSRYFRAADSTGLRASRGRDSGEGVVRQHDLLSLKPPREDFSLIVCKNVLLHFNVAQRCQVLHMFHCSMRPGGLLATEHTQKMPASLGSLFEPIAGYAEISASWTRRERPLARQWVAFVGSPPASRESRSLGIS